ncbi:hypothetical protein B0T10DRAFT_473823 [Thelonectria olida]|uniref:RRM domain-containing protein n=1 Tax=Thelonectria olida TaxID=1576542 RepID=A0A9P8WEN7_9HYPO|nr:hypothetical protein B0T10DRAFT_473823 [Thelonectria olida]
MAYPPPPGIGGNNSNLPPRPPASKSGFKPAFSSGAKPAASSYSNAPTASYAAPSSYSAAAPAASQYGPSYPSYSSSAAPGSVSSYAPQQPKPTPQGYGPQSYGPQSYGTQSANYGPQSYGPQSYSSTPQIRNPFPIPGAPGSDFDPEMAAQIAQWQSAYVTKDGSSGTDSPRPEPQVPVAAAQTAATDRKKTVVRQGGGKKWTDETLLEWDPSHLRLFVGNLAGETTDDSLLKAFSRWKSVQKARVIREKRTQKSKGYGFVSFSDADDFFQAAKEMNGKYIQSHPVVVRKANTEIKVSNVKDKNKGGNKWNNKKKGNNAGSGAGGGGGNSNGYEPSLGPVAGGGVTKPGQKTKNGLRLLG